jgi:hypothetical protein
MAFADFADKQYIKTIETGETIRLGSFSTTSAIELRHIRLTMFVQGGWTGAEQGYIEVYHNTKYLSTDYVSDLMEINTISVGAYWIGWVRFDFDRFPLNPNTTYYPVFKMNNYVGSPSQFVGLCADFPFPIYDNGETLFYNHPLQLQVFGYSE